MQWLRRAGHDVVWALELPPATDDDVILALAETDGRALVTSDRDFGELVFRQRRASAGVLLLRYRARTPDELLAVFSAQWPSIEPRLAGAFVVAHANRLRVRPLP